MVSPKLLAMGNPLLDMQVRDGEALLEKYGLKANDAILAEEKQQPIYDDLKDNHKPIYVAGGAAQNAARAAQYVLPAGSTAYIGCVGADDFADQLRKANEKEGLHSAYQVLPKGADPTGTCAVVITGHHRSLCTKLGAAEKFSPAHLEDPAVKPLIESAQFYYLGGFFLTHGLQSALSLAKQAAKAEKVFAMNLSAPFIPQFFKSQVDEMMPFVDIVFGNESEAEAWATAHDMSTKDLGAIAAKIASGPKENSSRPRVVVITHGAEATLVATKDAEVKTFPVSKLADDAIVDTNGAGDAFAGGFCGAYVLGKSVDESVEVGHRMGQMCVGQVGPTFAFDPKVDVLKA